MQQGGTLLIVATELFISDEQASPATSQRPALRIRAGHPPRISSDCPALKVQRLDRCLKTYPLRKIRGVVGLEMRRMDAKAADTL